MIFMGFIQAHLAAKPSPLALGMKAHNTYLSLVMTRYLTLGVVHLININI